MNPLESVNYTMTLFNIKAFLGLLLAGFLTFHYASQSLANADRVATVLGSVLLCFWLVTWLASPRKAPPPQEWQDDLE